MRIIIDTHVLIWYLNGDESLPVEYISLMHNPQNKLVISIATLWELVVKLSLKKLDCSKNLEEIEVYLLSKDYEILNISFSHLNILNSLPYHHKDPFDRLLIAQAISEQLPILSVDRYFKSYPINVI